MYHLYIVVEGNQEKIVLLYYFLLFVTCNNNIPRKKPPFSFSLAPQGCKKKKKNKYNTKLR